MRLLDTTSLELKTFIDADVASPYAILSHTWDTEELLFEDIIKPRYAWESKKGYEKVINSCRLAKNYGYGYIWIDTCCIDKSSSAELSEGTLV